MLGLVEMRRILLAERIHRTYSGMMGGDMVAWQTANPKDFEFITVAAKLYESRKKKAKK